MGGIPAYRLDLAYPHARVAIEYDGGQRATWTTELRDVLCQRGVSLA